MRNLALKVGLFAAVLLAMAASVWAAPSDYTFTKVIDSTSGLGNFYSPAINNHGQVLFIADDGISGFIYRADPGHLTLIAKTMPGFGGPLQGGINDSGVVSFSRQGMQDGTTGIYTSDGITTTTIAENKLNGPPTGWGEFAFGLGRTAIGNDGTVVFTGNKAGTGFALFATANGQITTTASGPIFETSHFADDRPAINDHGQVVFEGFRPSDGAIGLFRADVAGGPIVTIFDSHKAGDQTSVGHDYSINNSGRVAFTVLNQSPPFSGFMAASDGGPVTVFPAGGDKPSINDSDEIAFLSTYIRNGKLKAGIFMGPDREADRVIGGGDPLFGGTMLGVQQLDSNGLNDKGQVAFMYILEDGETGIGVATPRSIPEPASVALVACILLSVKRQQRPRIIETLP